MKRLVASVFLLLCLLATVVLAVPGAAANLGDPSLSKGMNPLVRITAISSTLGDTITEASCTVEAPGVPPSECHASAHGVGVASADQELGYFQSLDFTSSEGGAKVTVQGLIAQDAESLAGSSAVARSSGGGGLAFSFGFSNGAATAWAGGTLTATAQGTNKHGNPYVVAESKTVQAFALALVAGVVEQARARAAADYDKSREHCVTDTKEKSNYRFVEIQGTKLRFLIWVDSQASVTGCASASASTDANEAEAASSGLAKSSALARLLVFWEEKGAK